jgi:hypothetical protein
MRDARPVQDNLKRLRQKYTNRQNLKRPPSIDEQSWKIFTECVYEKCSLSALGRQTQRTPTQIRRILFEIERELSFSPNSVRVETDSPLESLDLSVRSRNALHRLGCRTVGEVNALDLTQSLRQIGSKGKLEVFAALERGGFRHPAMDAAPSAELSRMTRSLERLKMRISKTLEAVTREISAMQERLAKAGESL